MGIREQPATTAAATMQAINRHALRAPLGALIVATVVVPTAAGVMALVSAEPGASWAVAG